jgi:D-alanyl-lipoteichoic acid acyltransferase DltB (MBOAT superfamily)
MITFVLGGLWHGASWMFVIWGALHGGALIMHRAWKRGGYDMPNIVAWIITFAFINVTWIFFRATSLVDATSIIHYMFDFSTIINVPGNLLATSDLAWGGVLSDHLLTWFPEGVVINAVSFIMIAVGLLIVPMKNSVALTTQGDFGWRKIIWMILLFTIAMYSTLKATSTVFLYFNF